jgi:hypothetical protein
MAEARAAPLHKCRSSGCGCTVAADEPYCSEHCEKHASSAIRAGQGCECGHPECKLEKPPAV